MRGPRVDDCWLWVGAIGSDGYGRFWLNRGGHKRVIAPHRYALTLALGRPLARGELALHEVCDNPLCVRAHQQGAYPGRPHITVGTQTDNMATMARKGRGALPTRGYNQARWYGLDRHQRHTRSIALRAAARHGWNQHAINTARTATEQPTLF